MKACISTRWIVWLLRVHYCSVWFTKTVLLLVWAVPCWWRWLFKSRFVKWLFAAPKALSPVVVLRLWPEPVGPVAMLCLFKLVTPACLLRPTLGAEGGREASVRPSPPPDVTCPFSGPAHPPGVAKQSHWGQTCLSHPCPTRCWGKALNCSGAQCPYQGWMDGLMETHAQNGVCRCPGNYGSGGRDGSDRLHCVVCGFCYWRVLWRWMWSGVGGG